VNLTSIIANISQTATKIVNNRVHKSNTWVRLYVASLMYSSYVDNTKNPHIHIEASMANNQIKQGSTAFILKISFISEMVAYIQYNLDVVGCFKTKKKHLLLSALVVSFYLD